MGSGFAFCGAAALLTSPPRFCSGELWERPCSPLLLLFFFLGFFSALPFGRLLTVGPPAHRCGLACGGGGGREGAVEERAGPHRRCNAPLSLKEGLPLALTSCAYHLRGGVVLSARKVWQVRASKKKNAPIDPKVRLRPLYDPRPCGEMREAHVQHHSSSSTAVLSPHTLSTHHHPGGSLYPLV
jgi:hypothetical protein